MSGESAKGLLDRGQHGWLLPNPCQGDLGADKQAPGDSCAHKMGSGKTIDFRLVFEGAGKWFEVRRCCDMSDTRWIRLLRL